MRKITFMFVFILFAVFSFTEKWDGKARIFIDKNVNDIPIPGYVFFDGFDFEHYKPETGGIVPMLQRTHELLRNNYAASKQPFVFVGHSQGGLRALAMATRKEVV